MKKLKLLIELKYDADLTHGSNPEGIGWFFENVLGDKVGLILHSNKLGDSVGTVDVLQVLE